MGQQSLIHVNAIYWAVKCAFTKERQNNFQNANLLKYYSFFEIFFLIFRSLHEMMIAPSENLSCRVYNVAAMSFTPDVLYKAVQKHVPNLEIKYNVDDRQKIGETISKKKSFCVVFDLLINLLFQLILGLKFLMTAKQEKIGVGSIMLIWINQLM